MIEAYADYLRGVGYRANVINNFLLVVSSDWPNDWPNVACLWLLCDGAKLIHDDLTGAEFHLEDPDSVSKLNEFLEKWFT